LKGILWRHALCDVYNRSHTRTIVHYHGLYNYIYICGVCAKLISRLAGAGSAKTNKTWILTMYYILMFWAYNMSIWHTGAEQQNILSNIPITMYYVVRRAMTTSGVSARHRRRNGANWTRKNIMVSIRGTYKCIQYRYM